MTQAFFEQVYALLQSVPSGRVTTYGRLARLAGRPGAARSVGWALHGLSSRDAPKLPWWRVVNARGHISIGGDGRAAAEQRARLEAEGIVLDRSGRIDLERHLWP